MSDETNITYSFHITNKKYIKQLNDRILYITNNTISQTIILYHTHIDFIIYKGVTKKNQYIYDKYACVKYNNMLNNI